MTVADYSLTIFVALNVARAIAYWPQIVSIRRDPGSASAVSLWTWIIFTTANIATVIYALAGLGNLVVAAVFAVNAFGCAAIVTLITYKRCHDRLEAWESFGAGLTPEPNCKLARHRFFAIAPARRTVRTIALRLFTKWRNRRWAAHRRRIRYIAGKGPFVIE